MEDYQNKNWLSVCRILSLQLKPKLGRGLDIAGLEQQVLTIFASFFIPDVAIPITLKTPNYPHVVRFKPFHLTS